MEIPHPLLEGKAARIGAEESVERGGFVRLVIARLKYAATTLDKAPMPSEAPSAAPTTNAPAVTAALPTCSREELAHSSPPIRARRAPPLSRADAAAPHQPLYANPSLIASCRER